MTGVMNCVAIRTASIAQSNTSDGLLAEITENFPQHLSAVMLAGGAADAVDVPQNAAP